MNCQKMASNKTDKNHLHLCCEIEVERQWSIVEGYYVIMVLLFRDVC